MSIKNLPTFSKTKHYLYFLLSHLYSKKKIMINTYNETDLHKFFKEKYAKENQGFTEVKVGEYICDIFTKESSIIEIQTTSLYKLVPKIESLSKNYRTKVVFPFPFEKYIENYSETGELLSCKRSPKKNKWINIFTELFGILPLILEKKVELEIVAISISEKRIKTENPVQTKNKSRRFLKNWYKVGKSLNQIIETKNFSSKKDFIQILKEEFIINKIDIKDFTATDLKKYFTKRKLYLVISLLNKNGLIELTKIEKNKRHYKLSSY